MEISGNAYICLYRDSAMVNTVCLFKRGPTEWSWSVTKRPAHLNAFGRREGLTRTSGRGTRFAERKSR